MIIDNEKECKDIGSLSAEPPGSIDDEYLIKMFFDRSEDAILYTKKKYGAMCRNILYRILGDKRDAEECDDDVYLHIWNAIPPEKPRFFKAYLARVSRNVALDKYNYNMAAQRSSALTEAFDELEQWLPACIGDPEAETETAEFQKNINAFLYAQSKEARIFFLRRYWYGESIREIAENCHVSEAKVKTSLFRTRERLKAEFMKERKG